MPEQAFGMKREYVEIPGVGRVWVVGVPLDGREARAMGSTVYVCAVFHLDGLLQIGNQPPELVLDIILGDWPVAIQHRVYWHLVLEIGLLELGRLLLELLERVQPALLEAELAIADKASWAIPLRLGLDFQGRI